MGYTLNAQRSRRGGGGRSSPTEKGPSGLELQRLRILGTWKAIGISDYGFDEVSLTAEGDKLNKLVGTVSQHTHKEGRAVESYKTPLIDPKFDGQTLSFKYQEPSTKSGSGTPRKGGRKVAFRLVGENELQDVKNPSIRLKRAQQGGKSSEKN